MESNRHKAPASPNQPLQEHVRRVAEASRVYLFALVLAQGFCCRTAAALPSPLDAGYHEMYDLRFDQARIDFEQWRKWHPADPMGPASEAASYLFAEFDRLGILRSRFFVDDQQFRQLHTSAPDPAAKHDFENAIAESSRLADARLARAPDDSNALLAKVMNEGLRADYLALIEGRDLASLKAMKRAAALASRLLRIDPTCYDAYLATGAENYLLSLNRAPVRWMLRLYGVETDRARGLRELQITAEKGRFLRPYARLLLAVAALRDNDPNKARELLAELAHEFPGNPLYEQELTALH